MEKLDFTVAMDEKQKDIREKTYEKLMKSPRMKSFMKKNKIDKTYIYEHCGKISDWNEQCEICDRCHGLDFCTMPLRGHFLDLYVEDGCLMNEVQKCRYLKQKDAQLSHRRNYVVMDAKEAYLQVSLDTIDLTKESKDYLAACKAAMKLIAEPEKGLYLYGQPGVGKTYLMAAVTNDFTKHGRKTAFVNVPKYISELKMLFHEADAFERKVRLLKNVDILVLDDIGGESVTAWSRDEILLPLLDERMEKGKLTLFTSNYSMAELQERLGVTNNAMKEPMAAKRLLDRIKALSVEVFVKGASRRK